MLPLRATLIAAIAVAGLFCGSGFSYWGLGLTRTGGKADAAAFSDEAAYRAALFTPAASEITQDGTGYEFSWFVETEGDPWRVGLSAGLGSSPGAKLKETFTTVSANDSSYEFETSYFIMPVTAYVKYQYEDFRLAYWFGGGADYCRAKTKISIKDPSTNLSGTASAQAFLPHLDGGAEFFVTRNLSLLAGLRYMFSTSVDNFSGDLTGPVSGNYALLTAQNGAYRGIGAAPTPVTLGNGVSYFGTNPEGFKFTLGLRYYFKGLYVYDTPSDEDVERVMR